MFSHTCQLRVRYSESDQMGTFYNSRLLEWMEVGRSELTRAAGKSYAEWEGAGVMAPIVEANLKFKGRAGYDDLLNLETCCEREGRARLKFNTVITMAETGQPVAEGFTIHALTSPEGRPIRIPGWIEDLLNGEKHEQ
ncbi:thioesterase family protein [Pontiellaceae bacterium B12227]|nr:thioesterase family protein [Pontiellaceae bacterium B12227]